MNCRKLWTDKGTEMTDQFSPRRPKGSEKGSEKGPEKGSEKGTEKGSEKGSEKTDQVIEGLPQSALHSAEGVSSSNMALSYD